MSVLLQDTGTEQRTGVAATTFTYTGLTATAGSNVILIASVAWNNNQTGTTPTATWNGVSMTLIGNIWTTGNGGCALFGLVAPATGNQNLVVTWTGGNSSNIAMSAYTYSGANQTGGTTTFAGAQSAIGGGSDAIATVGVTSATNHAVLAVTVAGNTSVNLNSTSATNLYIDNTFNVATGAMYQAGSSGTVTSTATYSGNQTWGILGVDIVAAGGGGGTTVPAILGLASAEW